MIIKIYKIKTLLLRTKGALFLKTLKIKGITNMVKGCLELTHIMNNN